MCYVLICYKNQEKRWSYQSQTIIVYWIRSSDQVDIVVVHCSCYNKLPQTRLKTTQVFSVLEVRSPKSKCGQGHIFSEDSREKSFLASSSLWWLSEPFGGPWLSAASLWSLSPSSRGLLPLVSVSSLTFL